MTSFNFGLIIRFKAALLLGLLATLKLTGISITLGCVLGFIVGSARSARSPLVRRVAGLYVEIFRGVPVIVQVFWIFFCLPLILDIEIPNTVSGVIALTLYMGALTSETFRASIRMIGREQLDACVALGLSPLVQMTSVVLPQAVLRAVPTLLSNCVTLFKESSLVSAVGLTDLMFVGQNISDNTAHPVEVLTAVALIYFVIAFPLTRLVTRVERRILARLAT